jgi:hypothetical protein
MANDLPITIKVMRTICCRIYSMHSPHDRRRTYSLATRCSLYAIPGLKGQNNSAQGKVSGGTNRNVALGKGYRGKTVRGNSMNKANNSLRTKLQNLNFGKYETLIFVRNMNFTFINVIARTISLLAINPGRCPGL